MVHSVRFTCVLDTNVIYPIEIRDILLWFAHYDLYTPKWSQHIFDEWENVMRRKVSRTPKSLSDCKPCKTLFQMPLWKTMNPSFKD